MRGFFDGWCEAVRFACEAQGVISMRLALIAEGGPQAAAETHQMVAEKLSAFAEGQIAAVQALAQGEGPWGAGDRAFAPAAAMCTTTVAACRARRIEAF